MILGNASRGRLVATSVREAPAGFGKLSMLRAGAPGTGEALRFIGPAFWVPWRRPELDLVFLDRRGLVVAAVARLRAWRAAGPFEGAVEGVVLPAGTCERVPIHAGDRLEFTPTTGERIAAGAKPPSIF